MKDELERQIAEVCESLLGSGTSDATAAAAELPRIGLERPEERFGDFSTNVALQLAARLERKPRELAEELAGSLREKLADRSSEVSVAGPGFINLKLNDAALLASMHARPTQKYAGREVLVEFGDPNPFKAMHIGHLYSYVSGDAISSLLEAAGAQIRRLSYHGDVGLHVAKAIWAMQQEGAAGVDRPAGSAGMGALYAKGAKAYEEDEQAKVRIDEVNALVYAGDQSIKELYDTGKKLSFEGFDATLAELGIKTDRRYLESESTPAGLEMVQKNTGRVFKKSQGAIIYEGEKVGLHSRVFITGKGLPTYEAKDLGLTALKDGDYPDAAQSVIITAHEQAEYFKVMLAALAEINPALAVKTRHISHGFVSLTSGKMSSRTGDIYGADDLLKDVEKVAHESFPGATREVQIGAIKYAFSRHRLGGDLVYDVEESVSLEGNSGPYLQYAYARARSILRKAGGANGSGEADDHSAITSADTNLEPGERTLVRKIGEYAETVDKAVAELMPHHICTYLYELAQTFNRFYENNRVVGDPRQAVRLSLVDSYADKLQNGLSLLGIASPDKM